MTRTRIVNWLRVILPLCALVILSTLFLFSSRPDTGGGLPYGDLTPEDLAQRAEIGQPSYAAVSIDGTEIEMTAESATPGRDGGRGSIARVSLSLRAVDGLVSDLNATGGEMEGDRIRLFGDVELTTSSGWQVTSQELIANTTEGTLVSPQQVDVAGPFGALTAGGMSLARTEAGDGNGEGNHVLDLNGGVRMIYRP